jgi:hypothetical protein
MKSARFPLKLPSSSLTLSRSSRFFLGALVGLFCLSLIAGSAAPGAAPGAPPGAKTITQQVSAAQGGTVASPTGGLTLSIPAGALEKDTIITIEELAPGEGPVVGPAYEFKPAGLKFKKPATLTLRFKPADIPEGYEKEDIAIIEEKPQSPAPRPQQGAASGLPPAASGPQTATGAPPMNPVLDAGLIFLDSEVNVAAGTVTARIEHFSRYSVRAYSSYTLGSGKGEITHAYDLLIKDAKSSGSGYAEVQGSVKMGGEFFEKVGAKTGVNGVAAASMVFGKFFRVKAGKKGQKSTSSGQLIIDIDHSAMLTANIYQMEIGVTFTDFSGQPAGKANFPVQDLNSRLIVLPGHASLLFHDDQFSTPKASKEMAGLPYKPGTFSVWFDQGQWQAGRFYIVFVYLNTGVFGVPEDPYGQSPAMGGEVRWTGGIPPGYCLVRAFRIEG